MRRILTGVLVMAAAMMCAQAALAQESLGTVARQLRMQKPATPTNQKVYTNDNLPTSGGLGVVSVASANEQQQNASSDQNQSNTAAGTSNGANGKKAAKAEDPVKAQEKLDDSWKKKIADQKSQIDLLQRELDVLQREAQIRAAVFYADAGTQLRDPKKYHDEVQKNQQDTEAKQKALDDAKQKLADMQDEARKAGASESATE